MKQKRRLLASAIVVAASTGVQAGTPPPLETRTIDNAGSSAAFAGGATINGGVNFLTEVPADQAPGVEQWIDVADEDVGAEGDLYQVINVGPEWYQRAPSGWTAWDTRVASLEPFATRGLASLEVVTIEDVEAAVGGDLADANVRVHVGYATDSTVLTYSQAVDFDIAPPPPSSCPSVAEQLAPVVPGGKVLCVLSGEITTDLRMTANFDWVLSGGVFVGGDNTDSADLTVDAGTRVFGESGDDFLVIRRGSKIHVNGTPEAPVVMTSANDAEAGLSTRGQWGGLIINGNAPINGCSEATRVCTAEGEGSTGTYGGNDPEDSSGNLNYLQVRYAGYEITPENELNGIAFQAVGSGTLVDYVQVHNNSDDGVEFFGGNVNVKHLFLTGNSDDSLDWVLGWQGKAQHVVIYQTDEGDQGFESDNLDTARDALPRSRPTIANVTLVGNANTDIGMLLREGTGANISNAVVTGFGDACIDIDHAATFSNAGSSAVDLSGELTMTHSIVDCDTPFDEEVDDDWSVEQWFANQTGNQVGGAGMSGTYINSDAVNAMTPASPDDPFFDPAGHVGAVRDAESDWTRGWTFRGFEDFEGYQGS